MSTSYCPHWQSEIGGRETIHLFEGYSEWLHRQGGSLAYGGCNWRFQDQILAVAELHQFILCTRHSEGTAHEGTGCDQSIDLPSLMQLSVAGCGQLQQWVPHWATSVDYCKIYPCGLGDKNSANVCPCACHKRRLTKGYIPLAYCMHDLLACSEVYMFGQLGTGLSWFR